jgi:hypothetical protein
MLSTKRDLQNLIAAVSEKPSAGGETEATGSIPTNFGIDFEAFTVILGVTTPATERASLTSRT